MDIKGIDFYFITSSRLTKKTIFDDVKAALAAGVKIVQYREEKKAAKDMVEEASKIKELCKGKAIFIVNNRVDIAMAIDSDGVHLGQDDMPYGLARAMLGHDKIIGLTVHDAGEASEAEALGADYVGASPIFATTTKLDAGKAAGLQLLRDIRRSVNIPIVAIGGVNLGNIGSVIKAGADSAAAMSAVIPNDDVMAECKSFIKMIKDSRV